MAPDDRVTLEEATRALAQEFRANESDDITVLPPDSYEDLEALAYDMETPEGVTRYVENKLNQATSGFADERIGPARRKMLINAMRAELLKIAKRLGYDDIICREDPEAPGGLLLGLINEPRVGIGGKPPNDDDSGGAA